MVLLIGFIITEASYVSCSTSYIRESVNENKMRVKSPLSMDLAESTLLFSLLQILWQAIFLIWHIYCICFNIKTEEWINWRKYPEFQVVQPQPGQPMSELKFWNPYDKGIVGNIKDFLRPE
uniref:Palmitoyltransferase ZDHHC17 n=2 Tax=Anthurium amnicola TaxID=1678845 RepID=A0A1D1YQX7_9ARAE